MVKVKHLAGVVLALLALAAVVVMSFIVRKSDAGGSESNVELKGVRRSSFFSSLASHFLYISHSVTSLTNSFTA